VEEGGGVLGDSVSLKPPPGGDYVSLRIPGVGGWRALPGGAGPRATATGPAH